MKALKKYRVRTTLIIRLDIAEGMSLYSGHVAQVYRHFFIDKTRSPGSKKPV
ncbi:MAG: hypothetical protein ACOCXD_00315 [Bacteroidota bacterium]